jgi:hypothetical protein
MVDDAELAILDGGPNADAGELTCPHTPTGQFAAGDDLASGNLTLYVLHCLSASLALGFGD